MPSSIQRVQPPLEFIPPAFNLPVLKTTQFLLPWWLKLGTSLTQIQAENVAQLVDLYHQFQTGKIRFLLAFRHPSTDDPYSLASLLWQKVPEVARQQGIPLKQPTHAHFIYDRGIPLWAGPKAAWLASRLGGTPIQRGKIDRVGLRSVRELFVNGQFPIAAAPEGATNGHNEIISPLEPGIAQMGFWCIEDLLKAGRSEQVFIVPLGVQYRFVSPPWDSLEKLLQELEAAAGLPPSPVTTGEERLKLLYQRLYRLGEQLLTLMEGFYSRFYHQPLQVKATPAEDNPPLPSSNQEFSERLQVLLDTALKVAEQYFDLQPKGSVIDRCRRLEQAGWDWIYREDLKNLETLPELERGLADRIAEEASLRMWHMRLVESFVAVTGQYVREKPTVERFAETLILTWDMVTRIKGGNPFQRPRLGQQWVQLTVGQPLSVSDRWETYQTNRRSAKQAVETLTQDLQTALQSMIF